MGQLGVPLASRALESKFQMRPLAWPSSVIMVVVIRSLGNSGLTQDSSYAKIAILIMFEFEKLPETKGISFHF